jgi:hypothetical protein
VQQARKPQQRLFSTFFSKTHTKLVHTTRLVVPITCSQKLINYLAFQPFKLELTRGRLFQKRVVCTNFVCVLEKKVEKSLQMFKDTKRVAIIRQSEKHR